MHRHDHHCDCPLCKGSHRHEKVRFYNFVDCCRKGCCLCCCLLAFWLSAHRAEAQRLDGRVQDKATGKPLADVQIIINSTNLKTKTDSTGRFYIHLTGIPAAKYKIIAHSEEFKTAEADTFLTEKANLSLTFLLDSLVQVLEAVVVQNEGMATERGRLRGVEGTVIYEGKKTEVVLMDRLTANTAVNNPRQIFAKVAGLSISQTDGAGIQLNIGARGLSPHRTANFNTRQNGYDMSADAYGYPESYYNPPAEALERIEVVRGAASLQYGTQFGGMVNFVMKKPQVHKKFDVTARLTGGSFGFFNTFTSVGGRYKKWSYFTFYQFKRGDGWRPNSGFNVHTTYASVGFQATKKLSLTLDYTFMYYNAQQPGGLTDALFNQNPRQSIRNRNWFTVGWNLFALNVDYHLNSRTRLNIRNFGLVANRYALGFLGQINRVDPMGDRDLIKDDYRNFGNETRLLHSYDFLKKISFLSVGFRYYQGYTHKMQGAGTSGFDANFNFLNPKDLEGSDYEFPSRNVSFFAENIFNLTHKFSLTPGFRVEYIATNSAGYYKVRTKDLAGNILYEENIHDQTKHGRFIALAGVGASYKHSEKLEGYANFSQNYRAVTFTDLRVANPNFAVDPNLKDERGYNADLGVRGQVKNYLQYDVSLFLMSYANRIGSVMRVDSVLFSTYRYRTNVSDARTLGFESFAEIDLLKPFTSRLANFDLSVFANFALLDGRYVRSQNSAYDNKKVEFTPAVSLKTGVNFRWRKLKFNYQITYSGQQFTDATNAVQAANAVDGLIPAYFVMDCTASYTWRWFTLSATAQNLANAAYFTWRAAGYPGPGVMPSDGRSAYVTLEAKF